MYNKELLDSIKEQGKGVINTKRDYKLMLDADKKEVEKENNVYEYSLIYSVVYDGNDDVKITYANWPRAKGDEEHDPLKDYTNFRYLHLTLKDIDTLKFID